MSDLLLLVWKQKRTRKQLVNRMIAGNYLTSY